MIPKIFWPMILVLCLSSASFARDLVKQAQINVKKSIDIKKKTQVEEDKWREERSRLIDKIKDLKEEIKLLEYQNINLRKQKNYLQNSIKKLNLEIEKAGEISKDIMPFLNSIYDRIYKFIQIDLPFLKEERLSRLNHLRKVLDDDTIPISEKYRKTMETLFIEEQYGRTTEVYKDRINLEGKEIVGNIFRFGRISLFFQSPDKKQYAMYDITNSRWIPIRSSLGRDIDIAIEIASKKRPVEIVRLPLGKVENRYAK
ncbi:DUF3450 domain-containing protein [Desulfothermus okinawensis JCM 13304]